MEAFYYNIQFVNSSGDVLDDVNITVSCITEEGVEAEALRVFQGCTVSKQEEISGFYVTGADERTLGKCWYCRIDRVVSISVTRV